MRFAASPSSLSRIRTPPFPQPLRRSAHAGAGALDYAAHWGFHNQKQA